MVMTDENRLGTEWQFQYPADLGMSAALYRKVDPRLPSPILPPSLT
jgi:hypothetical protein